MTTIANFVVAGTLDPSGITGAMDQALGTIRRQVDGVSLDKLAQEGVRAAQSIENGFRESLTRIRGQVEQGIIDPKAAAQQGRAAGEAAVESLMSTLLRLRFEGAATPEAERALIDRMNTIGKNAGDALVAQVQRGATEVSRVIERVAAETPIAKTQRETNRGARELQRLIIETSIDNNGLKQGLDQALGFTRRFARAASEQFKTLGTEEDGVRAAQHIIAGLEREMATIGLRLKEQRFRGVINDAQFEAEGVRAAQAFNHSLLASLEAFRIGGVVGPEIEAEFVNRLSQVGLKGGEALARNAVTAAQRGLAERQAVFRQFGEGLSRGVGENAINSFNRLGIATDAATGRFSKLQGQAGRTAIAVAFAAEGIGSSTESGVRTALRAIATFGLAFGPEGLIVTALATGALAISDYFMKAKKEADDFNKHIGDLANQGRADALKEEARKLFVGQPFRDGQLMKPSQAIPGAFQGGIADLRAQRAELVKIVSEAGSILGAAEANARIKALDKVLNPLEQRFARLQTAIQNVASQPADTNVLPIKVIAQKVDTTPYADLTRHVDALAASYAALTDQGQNTASIQATLQGIFRQTGNMLADLPDKATKTARALAEIQKTIAATGVLKPIVQAPPLSLATPAEGLADLAKRVQDAREFGELSIEALTATQRLTNATQFWTREVEAQGGPLKANRALVDALAGALRELDAAQKAQGKEILTPESAASLQQAIERSKEFLAALKTEGRAIREVFEGARAGVVGLMAAFDGLGEISDQWRKVGDDIRKVGGAIEHTIGAFRRLAEVRRDREAAQRREAENPGTGGAMAGIGGIIAQVGAIGGVIGSAIGAVGSIIGLFQSHDHTIADNTRALDDLRLSLVDTMGVAGEQSAQAALTNLRELFARPNFNNQAKGIKDQQIEQAINQAGLSLDQFNKIMSDFNIKPEESGKWLDAFAAALQLATEAATRYNNNLDDQTALLQLHQKVFGTTTPQDQLQGTIDLLNKFAPALGETLQGFDTTTKEGQQGLREALQNLVTMIESGLITPEQLGTLTGVKDLGAIIGTLADSLDAMKEATDQTTQAMSVNIPAWYKIGAIRFGAADPGLPPGMGNTPPILRPPTSPADPRPSIPNAPQLQLGFVPSIDTVQTGATRGDVNIYGPVMIDARDKSAAELFDTVLSEGQRRAAGRFNDSTQWGRVQQ